MDQSQYRTVAVASSLGGVKEKADGINPALGISSTSDRDPLDRVSLAKYRGGRDVDKGRAGGDCN